MTIRNTAAVIASIAVLTAASAVPSFAQTKKSAVQKHPTATGIAAGVATHHALKVSAKNKKAQGKKLNAAEKHPTLSGIAAGAATRHAIKKHTP